MPRVLIIEDDAQVRMMLRLTFEDAGFEAEEAPDGKVGLRLYRREPADVVITDLIMPEKEGLETIRELKRDYPDVKIIAISGGGRAAPDHFLRVAEKFGALRTFTKPLDREKLVAAVREIVG